MPTRLPRAAIRAERAAGASYAALAKRYGTHVSSIKRACWGLVVGDAPAPAPAKIVTKKCLKCRAAVALPRRLVLCERCRKWAEAND